MQHQKRDRPAKSTTQPAKAPPKSPTKNKPRPPKPVRPPSPHRRTSARSVGRSVDRSRQQQIEVYRSSPRGAQGFNTPPPAHPIGWWLPTLVWNVFLSMFVCSQVIASVHCSRGGCLLQLDCCSPPLPHHPPCAQCGAAASSAPRPPHAGPLRPRLRERKKKNSPRVRESSRGWRARTNARNAGGRGLTPPAPSPLHAAFAYRKRAPVEGGRIPRRSFPVPLPSSLLGSASVAALLSPPEGVD